MQILKINGKDYELKYSTKSLVKMEATLGKNPLNVLMETATGAIPKFTDIMVMFHEALNTLNHGITLDDTYNLFDKYCEEGHSLVDLMTVISNCFIDGGFVSTNDGKN